MATTQALAGSRTTSSTISINRAHQPCSVPPQSVNVEQTHNAVITPITDFPGRTIGVGSLTNLVPGGWRLCVHRAATVAPGRAGLGFVGLPALAHFCLAKGKLLHDTQALSPPTGSARAGSRFTRKYQTGKGPEAMGATVLWAEYCSSDAKQAPVKNPDGSRDAQALHETARAVLNE